MKKDNTNKSFWERFAESGITSGRILQFDRDYIYDRDINKLYKQKWIQSNG